ncbi:hypothetical protein ACIGCK_01990 [Microbacterium sp. NPDC078428]|uniref:hypothetical protein n=1 Tax=Microbacterium sp. NPDC078428 TaxID=3364190 RepID=UPI0037C68E06
MTQRSPWPRGRRTWLLGTAGLLVAGLVVGVLLQNWVLGLTLGVVVSLGWLIAYESWRGRNVGVNDDDKGIQL